MLEEKLQRSSKSLCFQQLLWYTISMLEILAKEVTEMEERGFIRDMLDVKVLILFVAATAKYPLTLQKIYELCYQDDRLSYFDVSIAVPQMVESGHLEQLADETYVITEKGREQEEVTRDSIAFPVMQRAKAAVDQYNAKTRRSEFVKSEVVEQEDGSCAVRDVLKRRRGEPYEAGADRAE